MPIDPTPRPNERPVNAEGGWALLMHHLSRTTPARLYHVQRSIDGLRALRRR